MIEVKNLKKSFGSLNVLKGITTTINKGEKVVVIGPSGSGKSTLMNMIIGFLKPTKGRLLIDGESIENLNLSEISQVLEVSVQRVSQISSKAILKIKSVMEEYLK